jgi:hypothetical protein
MKEIKFPNLQAVLQDYIEELKIEYENNLLDSDRVASWDLINNIEIVTSFEGYNYWIGFNLKDYWKYVEYGTKPHFPPVDALLRWIEIKPVLPYPNSKGKLPTPKQLAYLIGRKISEVGTEGSHDLAEANKTIHQKYEELIQMALDEDIMDNIDTIVKVLFVK